jgi:outer membrane protein assembly factor BamB
MLLIQLVLKQRSTVFDRPEGARQRVDRLRLVVVVVAALTAFSAAVLIPTTAVAETATGSSSASVRYVADLSPLANGGVLANTAIGGGGVPTGGGDALVALNNGGDVDWNVPYEDQDQIWQAPVSDAAGNVYYVSYPGDGSTPQLVATRGGTVQWSKPVDAGNSPRPAVGANGQLYVLDGNSLRGLDAGDGHDLFPAFALSEFQSGSYDRLFAYDRGLVIYSGFGKILTSTTAAT